MPGFDVVVTALARAAVTAESAGVELRADLDSLHTDAGSVLAGEWTGGAAASFRTAWRDWRRDADDVITALDQLAGALHDSARAYSSADTHGRTTLQLAAS